jgi:hypothetical protein
LDDVSDSAPDKFDLLSPVRFDPILLARIMPTRSFDEIAQTSNNDVANSGAATT